MTVIATDGKTMAGDAFSTSNGTLLSTGRKVHCLKDGRIAGASGPTTECIKLIRWLDDGGDKADLSDDVVALVLRPDGSVYWIDHKLEPIERDLLPTAIGCGDDFAVGAMLAGASPKEAVMVAAMRMLTIGGEITVMGIE